MNRYSLTNLALYFLKLGAIGFGGPLPLMNHMERSLVEERGWISKEEYLRGLALAQLIPGPIAVHLAIYIGYVKGKILGATIVGIAFILPSFLIVLAISKLYVAYNGLEWMQALFYGVGAAVIGIIIKAVHNLSKLTLKGKPLLWAIFLLMFIVTAYTEQEIIWLFILSGFISITAFTLQLKWPSNKNQSFSIIPGLPLLFSINLADSKSLTTIFLFFLKSGSLVFGTGLAIVPFLHGGVVNQNHWLTEKQFLDAVAVAMITPGPVLITVGFIGYIIGGLPGSLAASLGVFLPSYLFVIIPAPYFERFSKKLYISAFIEGITSAAMGALTGAIIILGRQAISDIPTVLMAATTLIAIIRFKIPEPIIIGIAGLLGLMLFRYH